MESDIRSEAGIFLVIAALTTGLGVLFVAARIASRTISLGRYGADDYLCIVLSLFYLAFMSVAISVGGERRISSLTHDQHSRVLFYTILSVVPGILSFTIPKFAVVILLFKTFQPGPIHRVLMLGVSSLYALAVFLLLVFNFAQCAPVQVQWLGAEGKCWNPRILVTYGLIVGVLSATFDFYLALYPTVVLARLTMNWKKKLALSSSLGFGYCAGAVAIYKCTTITELPGQKEFPFALNDVMLWTSPVLRRGRTPTTPPPRYADDEYPHVLTIGSYPTRKRPVADDDLSSLYGEGLYGEEKETAAPDEAAHPLTYPRRVYYSGSSYSVSAYSATTTTGEDWLGSVHACEARHVPPPLARGLATGVADNGSRHIHILGVGNLGKLVAHYLVASNERTRVTLLFHRASLLGEWEAASRAIECVVDGEAKRVSGMSLDVEVLPEDGRQEPAEERLEGGSIRNLIVACKTFATVEALQRVRPRLGPDSTILFIQNGMGTTEEVTSKIFPEPSGRPRYWAGISAAGVYNTGPFSIVHAGRGP
ncbi:unnamed protein product [Parascedosporium putredinis]|uniref:Uncharacterized protein n=1 Tax=Parascedosporium putredinis TaxID=1442378 RepID=A0A9P1H976_9PEZI|nr:unnamed protein product [Parascedosporium putredinis]CAI8000638.1 unnamed protein product [Parascedosporium putredinis]